MNRWLKNNRGFILFLLCFGFFRLAIADWNPIPSGSMRPTILEGDVVLVDRIAYDFKLPLTELSVVRTGEPERGDVVVFTSPKDGVRLIKRLVGLPGDRIEMRNEVLCVNGISVNYSGLSDVLEPNDAGAESLATRAIEHLGGKDHWVQFLFDVRAQRSFGPLTVPDDHFFFLGDNRDNSADSRYVGFVPRHRLIGRAHHVLVSADIKGNGHLRLERFGSRIQ